MIMEKGNSNIDTTVSAAVIKADCKFILHYTDRDHTKENIIQVC